MRRDLTISDHLVSKLVINQSTNQISPSKEDKRLVMLVNDRRRQKTRKVESDRRRERCSTLGPTDPRSIFIFILFFDTDPRSSFVALDLPYSLQLAPIQPQNWNDTTSWRIEGETVRVC